MRPWLPLSLLLELALLVMSCGGGGGGIPAPTAGPPGPHIVSITICSGPPSSPGPTPAPSASPTPTATPCPAATSTTVAHAKDDIATFHAEATTNEGGLIDITNAVTTGWFSTDLAVLDPVKGEPGVFSGVADGCACIKASSGGISSNLVGVAVFTSSVPVCPTCSAPTSTPTPIPTSTPSGARVADMRAPMSSAHASGIHDLPTEGHPTGGSAGVLQWVFDAHAPIRAPLVVSADRLYFVSADSVLHGLDPQGNERLRRPALALAPALATGGTVYVQGTDHHLRALTPGGAELWRFDDSAKPIAVVPDETLFASDGRRLLSISDGGRLNWAVTASQVTAAAPVPGAGVIAGVAGGPIIALSADGAERWRFTPSGGFAGAIAIDHGIAYAGSGMGTLYAFSLDGAELWRVATPAPIRSGPAVDAGGVIYFGSDRFYAVTADGVRWRCDVVEPGEAAPTLLSDGSVFIAGADNHIGLLKADGSFRWGARLHTPASATVVAASGLIYVGSEDGRIYAIK
jgi:eukaryotic-like serine/threonine-protein kinase